VRGLAVVWLLMGGVASADPASSRGVCELEGLRDRVRALAGTDPLDAASRVSVRVETQQEAHGIRASLVVRDAGVERGRREIVGADCSAVFDNLALAIVMVLHGPERDEAPNVDERYEAPEAPTLVSRRVPAQVSAFAGGEIGHRGVRAVVGGMRMRLGARFTLGADVAAYEDELVSLAPGIARVDRTQGAIAACVHRGWLSGCGAVLVGWLSGRGEGLALAEAATTPLVGLGARTAAEWSFSRWLGIRIQLEVRALATSTRFTVDDMVVWASDPVEASLGLMVIANIP
jgi:hypothetical protein